MLVFCQESHITYRLFILAFVFSTDTYLFFDQEDFRWDIITVLLFVAYEVFSYNLVSERRIKSYKSSFCIQLLAE